VSFYLSFQAISLERSPRTVLFLVKDYISQRFLFRGKAAATLLVSEQSWIAFRMRVLNCRDYELSQNALAIHSLGNLTPSPWF
jgi:hypothetical protein